MAKQESTVYIFHFMFQCRVVCDVRGRALSRRKIGSRRSNNATCFLINFLAVGCCYLVVPEKNDELFPLQTTVQSS